jgi:ABC-type polysaccharide/polyol phosphate transport system ATPase subunit
MKYPMIDREDSSMYNEEIIIDAKNLSKRYEIYATPRDRLKQMMIPGLLGMIFDTEVRSLPQYFREFWALHEISFQVKKGETLGIVGRNGSGKSTLLQLICGTLSPTTGQISVKGRISALLELGSGFNPDHTGRENVFLNGQILGLTQQEVELKYQDIVDFADIGDFIDQPLKTYSSGMVVRLAFSVAVNVEPEILVVDEALAVGDMPFQIKCFAHLRKLRDRGASILFVSHDLSAVRSFCDRAVYLDHGKCLIIGTANEVCKQYEIDCLREKFTQSQPEIATTSEFLEDVVVNNNIVTDQILAYLEYVKPSFMKKEREGSQSVTIESFVLVGCDGRPVESIDPNQEISAYASLRFNKQLSKDFHFGIQVHDRQGSPLMVVRDSNYLNSISGMKDDVFVLSMTFRLPLQANQYYCRVSVVLLPFGQKYVDGFFNFEHSEVCDIVEYAAYFRVLPFTHHYLTMPVLNESKMSVQRLA